MTNYSLLRQWVFNSMPDVNLHLVSCCSSYINSKLRALMLMKILENYSNSDIVEYKVQIRYSGFINSEPLFSYVAFMFCKILMISKTNDLSLYKKALRAPKNCFDSFNFPRN